MQAPKGLEGGTRPFTAGISLSDQCLFSLSIVYFVAAICHQYARLTSYKDGEVKTSPLVVG